jgi:hypothetical protein
MVKRAPVAGSSSRSAEPGSSGAASSHVHTRAGLSARAFLFFGPTREQHASRWIRRWFRWRRAAAVGFVAFLLGLTILSWIAWRRSWQTPAWWTPTPSPTASKAAAMGEAIEQRVVNEGHRVRGGEPWELTLDEAGVNAWLGTRLFEWMASRTPPMSLGGGVREVRVLMREGRLYAAGRLDGDRIVAVGVEPTIDTGGRLALRLTSASVGRLGVPVSWAARALEPASRAGLAVEGGAIVAAEPRVKLADGRRVRIEGVEVSEGMLRVRCRTAGP